MNKSNLKDHSTKKDWAPQKQYAILRQIPREGGGGTFL